MARKITNISENVDSYTLLSQTPENYNKENFFLKELQDKVNAEWEYRHNRIKVDFEKEWGESFHLVPLEVVIQHVKNDTGTEYVDDVRRIVFKNIREKRFRNGSKFRFSNNFDPMAPEQFKNTWLVTNFENIKATTSAVIRRCNGLLGSLYKKPNGEIIRHYEPVVQTTDSTSVSLFYNQVASSAQSRFVGIVQCNKYTKKYYINQRFIVGTGNGNTDGKGFVYKIVGINSFYGLSTNNPNDVGLMKIYFEITEISSDDDFEHRIAHNSENYNIAKVQDNDDYNIMIVNPQPLPSQLRGKDGEVEFTTNLMLGECDTGMTVNVRCYLENLPENSSIDRYIDLPGSIIDIVDDKQYLMLSDINTFTLRRKQMYTLGDLIVQIYYDNNGEEVNSEFKLKINSII